MPELWTPGGNVEVDGHKPRVMPTERKTEGGTWFDDELETVESQQTRFQAEMIRLIDHLNKRPDHHVYVGSSKDREQLREVFNWWKREGAIGHNPSIRIDWGQPEGTIRVGDGSGDR